MSFIDAHRERWGVEPICQTLEIAPSTYYAVKGRRPCRRRQLDEQLKPLVSRVHAENFGVYGARKVWRQLRRESIQVGRDRVARLMRELSLVGVVRGKVKRTTLPGRSPEPAYDLVERNFKAPAPNRLWVADLTYVSAWPGFVYVAFVIDVFSRYVVGWRVLSSLRAQLAVDALEMALWTRRGSQLGGLVHHSDRGSQYVAVRYTHRLAEAGAVRSVGSRGDSYDNALAESVVGLYKAELIRRRGPWRSLEQVEVATAEWVDWWNRRRLHGTNNDLPPVEYESDYASKRDASGVA